MAPWLRARTILANDLNSCPAPTHLRLLRVVCNSSAKEFDALFWALMYIPSPQTYKCTHNFNNTNKS